MRPTSTTQRDVTGQVVPPPSSTSPRWLPAPRLLSLRHRRRLCPTGAVRQLRLRALRGGRARRSSGPAAGRTAGPGSVPGRGWAGLGRRRGRRPVDRRAHRATSANPGGSARGGRGLRPAARPPAPPYGPRSSRGSVPRLYAGRAEHPFGIGPRLRGVIGPPHHPQVVAAVRRSGPSAAGLAWFGRGPPSGVCCWRLRRCCSRARRRARYSGVPLVPMSLSVQAFLR